METGLKYPSGIGTPKNQNQKRIPVKAPSAMCNTDRGPTRVSFLQRLVAGDAASWQDFDAAYKPLLRHWLRNHGLGSADTEDLIQEVMLFVAGNLGNFQHNTRTGAFRKWLRSVTVNIARNFLRKRQREADGLAGLYALLTQLEDADSGLSRAFEGDYRRNLLHQLLRRSARGFSAETMSMFRQHVLEGADAARTAEAHGVSRAAVYIAKSRVLGRLREEWAEDFDLEKD